MSEVLRLQQDRVEWRHVGDGIVAQDRRTAEEFTVNAAGAALWDPLCAGSTTEELVAVLVSVYGIDRERAVRDVDAFCAMLTERGLISGDGVA